ncbi:alkaline phosphatase family protein [Oceanospirillum sediminis]|uniref:Alkaline phosphatase family protein n=1 Tax=Oceanospirillum sediminis TaxID=2760088 RepID=A0A839IL69_9GAMM|nr:alkaline phosphatase family protein [Oceanospirillum sediminis]MBB1486143.1 alkaline phosphatase family protein [Oceanospirillum sediminis]
MNNNKVILVVLDGLNYQTGYDCMGYLQALREQGTAQLYKLTCELPAISRPLYECILTGVTPAVSGIVHNDITRNSDQQSIFSLARQHGLSTAAAAYHWVSELYNRSPYDAVRDRHTEDESQLIQYGVFYHQDHYPDSHLFLDAEWLRRKHDPDFLLVHPMNIDDAGHKAGLDSTLYRNTARFCDIALSDHLPKWIEEGYQILVTSDHGMNNDRSHNGMLSEEREVPLFVIGERFSLAAECHVRQTELCGTICTLLGIDHDKPQNPELIQL